MRLPNAARTVFVMILLAIPYEMTSAKASSTPAIKLSATSLTFKGTEGGKNPTDQQVMLTNSGDKGSILQWTATSSEPWLTVTPASGSLRASGDVELKVHVNMTYQSEAWTGPTSTVNAPVTGSTGAWIGSSMLIWGQNTAPIGTFYSPSTNTWFGSTSSVNAPEGRTLHTTIWTGKEFIVWGGITYWVGTPLNDGGRYDPVTDTWKPMSTVNAPDARFSHTAVWTGTKMIVWGGEQPGYDYRNTGGIYDPATDTWTGATTLVNAPSPRGNLSAVWTGSRMIIWGGENPSKFNTGYFYDPVADAWTGTTSLTGAPDARSHHSAVWTGNEMIIWGGGSGGPHLDTGARYVPATDTWVGPTTLVNVSEPKASFAAVWTGSRMIVWGGESNGVLSNNGAFYRPPMPAAGPNPGTITITAPGASNSPQVIQVQLTVTP